MKNVLNSMFVAVLITGIAGLSSCTSTPAGKSGKPVLLAVSFGTSFNESRALTIGAIENALATAYPDYEVRRAFTSQIVIDVIKERDGEQIDNVKEALQRLVKDGVKDLVVQSTHLMDGIEYHEMLDTIKPFESKFNSVRYGKPLLSSDKDYDDLIKALAAETAQYAASDTVVVYMGHGTEAASNQDYTILAKKLVEQGYKNYLIGTVEAEPTLDDVIAEVEALGVKKTVLLPLMIVAGDHANNDMAGDEDDSWKSILESKGFTVTTVLKGLGQYPGVQQIFVRHVSEAIAK
ncbi:MAG: sirohydrochlorin cobaltochelatase [Spirochaetaceae bacterium]|jgi:sirohydrochlorin cobaltochelatase|nr:sirohydrochlorin cobaltochelatase [Spirochaetaceae bacterium]